MDQADTAILLSPPDVGALEEEYVVARHAVGLGRAGRPGPRRPSSRRWPSGSASRTPSGSVLGHRRAAPGPRVAGASVPATSSRSPR